MHPRQISIEDYSYQLPDDRIAAHPLAQRDASKLLVWADGLILDDIYNNIANHIPTGSLVVFNNTKVIHARLVFKKPSGGSIEVFCLEPADSVTGIAAAMQQKKKVTWKCLVGGIAKWKTGITPELVHSDPPFTLRASIIERHTGFFLLELSWDAEDMSFAEILLHAGKVPLPPYLHRQATLGDKSRYQTIFAAEEGSVAAPTAGLHFTSGVMESLAANGIATDFLTLHVGAGTFMPVKSETMEGHDMHAEWIEVGRDTLARLSAQLELACPIVAVGTTSLRTLESLYWMGLHLMKHSSVTDGDLVVTQWMPYEKHENIDAYDALCLINKWLDNTGRDKLVFRTQLLIAPGYRFRLVNGLVTNFHQPRSTLLLLVAAFIGKSGWRSAYAHALNHGYRFLSYGDGCLFWHRPEADL